MSIQPFLLASLFVAAMAASAQTTVFSDTFSGGSTINSTTPLPPTATSTSYEEIAGKTWDPNPPTLGANSLKFGITAYAGAEIQALFTPSPVTLISPGDYLQVAVTFTNMGGLLTQDTQFGVGLFNSGQALPFGGGLSTDSSGNTTPNAVTGCAQNWNGYVATIDYPTNAPYDGAHVSEIFTRPPQTGTDNRNQVTAVPGYYSGTYGYDNPAGTQVGNTSLSANVALLTGGTYTVVLTLTLQANGALQITDEIYTNNTSGALLANLTATTGATPATNSFDAFSIGFRMPSASPNATVIDISSIRVIKEIQPPCVTALASFSSSPVVGQTGNYVTINVPTNFTSSEAASVQLVSTNPAVAYPQGAPGGTLTVTVPKGAAYTATNVSITVVGAGPTLFYLTNASGGANCISGTSSIAVTAVENGTIFSDNFSNGSTINSTNPAPPTPNSTSYEEISGKSWLPNPPTLASSGLAFGIGTTSGNGAEIQALFTTSPVTLMTVGDYIQVAVTFTNVVGLLTQDSQFGIGLFNSDQSLPFAGGLNGTDESGDTTPNAVSGGAQNWNGYLACICYPSSLGGSKTSEIFTRLPQTGTDNRNQITAVTDFTSTYGYSNPTGTEIGNSSSANVALTNGIYTVVLTLTLKESGALQITDEIYTNNTSGALLTTLTETTGVPLLTNSFDAFSIGFRSDTQGTTSNNFDTEINLTSVQVAQFIQPVCISAAFVGTTWMVPGQTNGSVIITMPTNFTSSGPVSLELVSSNPAAAYPAGAPGGALTVTFPQDTPYSTTNVPIIAVGVGSTLLYLTNATSPACITADMSTSFANVTCPACVVPVLPTIPSGNFNVTNYGAVGDGVTTNTVAVQNTVNAAIAAGGGTVEVPAGSFLCGPFTLGSSIRFQLDAGATLLLLPFGSYPDSTGNPPNFMTMENGHDLEFAGPGLINAQGAAWWAYSNTNSSLNPPLVVYLNNCQRVYFHNWNQENPPFHHIVVTGNSGNITFDYVTNTATYPSPDTDGIDLFGGTNCLVENCALSGGDDNIAIAPANCQCANVLITNITCGTGHGISMGSTTSGDIFNVTVVNCTFSGTQYGLRLKSDNDRGGLVQNILYENIGITNVEGPIVLYSYYNEGQSLNVTPQLAASYGPGNVTSLTPIWRNITFSNITATGTTQCGILWGRPEMMVSNVTLYNVNITAPGTFAIYNARGIKIVNAQMKQTSGTTYTLYNAQVTLSNSVSAASGVSLSGLTGSNSLSLYNATATLSSSNLLDASPVTLSAGILTNSASLTLPAAEVLNFDPGSNLTEVAVTGNLTLNGTINIAAGNGFGDGLYTLFTYSGALSGASSLGTTPPGYICSLNTNTAGKVNLLVSPASPSFANGSLSLSNGFLAASGTGGSALGTYRVLTTTNLQLPLTQWTVLTTNQFDASGNFSFSTAFGSTNSQKYYLLRVP